MYYIIRLYVTVLLWTRSFRPPSSIICETCCKWSKTGGGNGLGAKIQNTSTVASFPGPSHLQYLVTCRMQMRRGKAWEIWSFVVTSDKQVWVTPGHWCLGINDSPNIFGLLGPNYSTWREWLPGVFTPSLKLCSGVIPCMLFITVVNIITDQVNPHTLHILTVALYSLLSASGMLLSACLANIWYSCMVIHTSWPRS